MNVNQNKFCERQFVLNLSLFDISEIKQDEIKKKNFIHFSLPSVLEMVTLVAWTSYFAPSRET